MGSFDRNTKTEELEKLLQKKMDEVYELRMELARRKGDVPKVNDSIDFEHQYLTD